MNAEISTRIARHSAEGGDEGEDDETARPAPPPARDPRQGGAGTTEPGTVSIRLHSTVV